MNPRIRELFEKHCLPNFVVGSTIDLSRNERGEYNNPTYEDHWQTFQEVTELVARECILTIQMGITRDGHNTEKYQRSMKHIRQIKEHFGVE